MIASSSSQLKSRLSSVDLRGRLIRIGLVYHEDKTRRESSVSLQSARQLLLASPQSPHRYPVLISQCLLLSPPPPPRPRVPRVASPRVPPRCRALPRRLRPRGVLLLLRVLRLRRNLSRPSVSRTRSRLTTSRGACPATRGGNSRWYWARSPHSRPRLRCRRPSRPCRGSRLRW